MKKALAKWVRERRDFLARVAGVLPMALILGGCEAIQFSGLESQPEYRPTNFRRANDVLPLDVRRVAVLPLAIANKDASLDAGVYVLQPILRAELEKTKRFEVVALSPEQMRLLTGQATWKPEEALPSDFFDRLHKSTDCDAVMFCQLTRYHAYPPLADGWKFNLVANTNAQSLWSADEVFDAGNPEVAKGARSYYAQHISNEARLSDSTTILRAPSEFGQYSLSLLFTTLPER